MASIRQTLATVIFCLLSFYVASSHQLYLGAGNQSLIDVNKCGTTDDLARRIEVCAKPLMDLIQGTIPKWPKNTAEVKELCLTFNSCEKCIRDDARKCAQGLHKTIIGTVAQSIQKARKGECRESKYPALLRTTQCFEKHQKTIHGIMSNITSHLRVIEEDFTDFDKKINAVCCMVNDMEPNIRRPMEPLCPEETKLIVGVIRTVLDDALNLICTKPKCSGVFKGYKVNLYNTDRFGGLIETILRIVFTLG